MKLFNLAIQFLGVPAAESLKAIQAHLPACTATRTLGIMAQVFKYNYWRIINSVNRYFLHYRTCFLQILSGLL
jgi:hypothetical protein